jgi:hypothetical protein
LIFRANLKHSTLRGLVGSANSQSKSLAVSTAFEKVIFLFAVGFVGYCRVVMLGRLDLFAFHESNVPRNRPRKVATYPKTKVAQKKFTPKNTQKNQTANQKTPEAEKFKCREPVDLFLEPKNMDVESIGC